MVDHHQAPPQRGRKNHESIKVGPPKTGYKDYKRIYLHKVIAKVNNVKSKATYIVCDPSLTPHPRKHASRHPK